MGKNFSPSGARVFDSKNFVTESSPPLTIRRASLTPIDDIRGSARYRGAAAGYDEAVAGYNRTVIDAYRQLADAAVAKRSVAERLTSIRAALTASEEAYVIAKLRYEGGLSTYLDVLTVEDRLLGAQLAMAELDAAARNTDIALIRALGGGYDPIVPIAKPTLPPAEVAGP